MIALETMFLNLEINYDTPNFWIDLSVLADILEEEGDPKCNPIRWMIAKRKRPKVYLYNDSTIITWYNINFTKGQEGDIESDLPLMVFKFNENLF